MKPSYTATIGFDEWSEVRLIAAIRWLLATTALTIIYLDPKEPDNHVWGFTYVVLTGYVTYTSALYFLAIRRLIHQSWFRSWAHWIDIAWFTVLIGLSSGTNRIFFFGFLFAILVASFRHGFKAGISVVLVSILSITIVGYATETASFGFEGYGFDVYRFILRPTFLIVLGYLMAHWGESVLESKRRLALLKDISLSNPRLGVDRTVASVLESLRDFYHADLGLLVMNDLHDRHSVYRAETNGASAARREELSDTLSEELLALPGSLAVSYRSGGGLSKGSRIEAFDVRDGQRLEVPAAVIEKLANRFDSRSFISVPTFRHREVSGRIYLSKTNKGEFDNSDVEFLLNVMKHANPIIENIRLVDKLASDAAERERQRIARDIHDSIIQPYIGFQIALSGLRRRIDAGQANVAPEVQKLTDMAVVGVADLRRYVSKLKNSGEQETTLLPAIERFATKFSDVTGIEVNIAASAELVIDDRLAAEVFQMVTEGLSNIRRHTDATQAEIHISIENKRLILTIENDGASPNERESFTPKSISERAISLNGFADVERNAGGTVVRVEIPL
jgi:signal transduction histidine kinase